MIDNRPGLKHHRLVNLIKNAIHCNQLKLDGLTVLTEAATGAYVVTPVLAAIAGAKKVFAIAKDSYYGKIEDVSNVTYQFAKFAGVHKHIEIIKDKVEEIVKQADIITNSGHVRPIDAKMIKWMKPKAVIPLMYETWELRKEDVDIEACRKRGILAATTNERNPVINIFSFLGILAFKLLIDAGFAVRTNRILLLCNNPFAPFIKHDLVNIGAIVDVFESLSTVNFDKDYDVILVALQPKPNPVLSSSDAAKIANRWQGITVAQFFGNIDRSAFLTNNIPVWPLDTVSHGHMNILLSEIGPEPIIQLQTGGLKVAELLLRFCQEGKKLTEIAEALEHSGFGTLVN